MAGGGGVMQIVWLIVILWVLVEFVFPMGKKLINQLNFRAQAKNSYSTYSYL